MAETAPVIIIKKKKSGGHGHHGGAWKVAYADFVTAMMALFIVLWLMNTSSQVKKAIGGYFKDPSGVGKFVGSAMAGSGESLSIEKKDMEKLKDRLEAAIKSMPRFETFNDQLEMTITGEGLRLELLETEHGMFFESGRPQPTGSGSDLIVHLASELSHLPNTIVIEGHTDSTPFAKDNDYGNWELSTDRANMARRIMQQHGMRADQIKQVRGYADQSLRDKTHPEAANNRRVTVIVQYMDSATPSSAGEAHAVKEKAGEASARTPYPS